MHPKVRFISFLPIFYLIFVCVLFSSGTKIDNALIEAEDILSNVKEHVIDSSPTVKLLDDTNAYLLTIEDFSKPVNLQNEKLLALRNAIGVFDDKLNDLIGLSLSANEKSNEAQQMLDRNKNASVTSIFDTVSNHSNEAQKNIDATNVYGKKGDIAMGEIYRHLGTLENVNNELKDITQQVDKELPAQEDEYTSLDDILLQAAENQNKLVAAVSFA